MHRKEIYWAGRSINEAEKVLIMLHGRGATAQDILSLADLLETEDFALLAPQATNHTWYPNSFLAPVSQNEPWLSSALRLLEEIVNELETEGFDKKSIYFLGFSQGACLTLEFTTRHASGWGGVVAFTGGLIGEKLNKDIYTGDFQRTPMFIGTSDPDPHVPVHRVNASSEIIRDLNGNIMVEIYKNRGHTIHSEEIKKANEWVFKSKVN